MDFGLGEDIDALRETVRKFALEEIAPKSAEVDRSNDFPMELWEMMGNLGLHGITISEETIYNNYRITKDFYSLIKQITKLMLDQGSQDVFREDIILLIFSHPSPPEIFLNLRNEALSHIVNLKKNS